MFKLASPIMKHLARLTTLHGKGMDMLVIFACGNNGRALLDFQGEQFRTDGTI
jgi:hypothetical protein